MIALIDGDIVLHRVGYTTDNDGEGIARARVNEMIDGILVDTSAKEFEIFLSDSKKNNFRYDVYPEYKANRVLPRPVHYEAIKEYLIVEWGARIAHGMEADDALGIHQDKGPLNEYFGELGYMTSTAICSIDKDLLQIPGQHFNFVKKEWADVTSWEGLKWFYKQILIGDVSDNVKGCKGIGPVKTSRILDPVSREQGEEVLFQRVFETYQSQEGKSQKHPQGKTHEEILNHIRTVGRLLKIKQQEDEPLWDFPFVPVMVESKSLSTQPKQEEHTPSTALMTAPECGSQSLGKQMDVDAPVSEKPSISVGP